MRRTWLKKLREWWQHVRGKSPEKIAKNHVHPDRRRYLVELGLGLVLAITLTLMFPRGKSYQFADLKEGDVYVGEPIIAPFTFPINKSDGEYERDVRRAREKVYPVFVREDSVTAQQELSVNNFFQALIAISDSASSGFQKTKLLTDLLSQFNVFISDENLSYFMSWDKPPRDAQEKKSKIGKKGKRLSPETKPKHTGELESFRNEVYRIIRDLYSIGILNIKKKDIPGKEGKISVREGGEEIVEELENYNDFEEVKSVALEKLRAIYSNDERKVKVGYQIITAFLVPNIFYDESETDSRIKIAVANVPRAKGTVLEEEKIIGPHEKVTREHLEKLTSLAVAKAEKGLSQGGIQLILPYVGRFLLITLSLTLLVIFVVKNRPAILKDYSRVFLIFVIMMLVSLLSFLINEFNLSGYLMPVTIASMLLTIFFDNRVGFMGTVTLSIILGGLRGNEFNVTVISIFVGTIAILSVSKIRTRNWLVRSLGLIMGSYLFSITVMELLRYTPFSTLLQSWLYGATNGFLSPVMTYGLLVILEYVFGVTTDMKLLELSDLNRPILKQLAMQAPGSYYHSIVVGNLSEAAAEAIGANSLLARVGAYYHDIGKMEKAEYFIENQNRGKNPHEKLTPSMSCLILINHVRRGLELASENKLPGEIHDAIAQHHGTSRMNYFYQKALERNEGQDVVNESHFRYPGPRPQTKEMGIIMLADAVEAAARSLKDPSVSRIKGMVNSIVQERFKESELDECPLTLRELNRIIESFQNILVAIFHARVEYPAQEEIFFHKNSKKGKSRTVETQNHNRQNPSEPKNQYSKAQAGSPTNLSR